MIKLQFEKQISASPAEVFRIMLSPEHYTEWACEFEPTSHYEGIMGPEETVRFLGVNHETGEKSGMISRIVDYVPGQKVAFEHIGLVHNGEDFLEGDVAEVWKGALEEYLFTEDGNGGTLIHVSVDTTEEYSDYFKEAWPKALDKLEEIAEQK